MKKETMQVGGTRDSFIRTSLKDMNVDHLAKGLIHFSITWHILLIARVHH